MPLVDDLTHTILENSLSLSYSIHPSAGKMYRDLEQNYWWSRMKCTLLILLPNAQIVTR